MMGSPKKVFFDEIEMMTKQESSVEASKMPRMAVIPVVKDKTTGYLNAAPYSGGILSVDPFHIVFGVKSWDSKLVFEDAEEFTLAIPGKDQVDQVWAAACSVPHGISEIDVAGWTEHPSREIETPGIKECRINFECKKRHLIKLGGALRNIVIGEVVGIHIDSTLLAMSRSDSLQILPVHEAIQRHPYTGTYALSVLSGEVEGGWAASSERSGPSSAENSKHYVNHSHFKDPDARSTLMTALLPRPTYMITFSESNGKTLALPVMGGLIMHTKPAVQIPIPRRSAAYDSIKRTGEFVISIPNRSLIVQLEALERIAPADVGSVGLTHQPSHVVKTSGIAECPVNIECATYLLEDVPGADYAFLLGRKVGLAVDQQIVESHDYMKLYSTYPYAVMDFNFTRKWVFHDSASLPIKPLPTWGSRYNGGWWGGPEQWQAGMQFWLVELLESGYIAEDEYHRIKRWISWWRSEGYPAPEPLRTEVRNRLTKLFNMMVYAHRDFDKWHAIHEYLRQFPYEGRWGC